MENKIEKAKEFATKAHKGQVRKGRGSPYTEHLEEVAKILMDMDASENVICAGWLHDTVEDTGVSLEQLTQEFGGQVAKLVAGHSEDKSIKNWFERKMKNMDFLPSSSKELQMLVLADKLANARTSYKGFEKYGDGLWKKLGMKKNEQAWYYGQGLKFLKKMSEYQNTWLFYEEFKDIAEKMFRETLIVEE